MTNANVTITMNAINTLFEESADGMYEGFMLDDLAEYMGITLDEADQLITDAVNDGALVEEFGDLYNAVDRADWEREQDEELEDWEQFKIDRAMGYAFACC